GRYPTNQLMRRRPIHQRQPKPSFNSPPRGGKVYPVLATVSRSYPRLMGRLPTCYSPVRHSIGGSKLPRLAFDLHVLGTPPAFILSQDQTLHNWKAHLELVRYCSSISCVYIVRLNLQHTSCVTFSELTLTYCHSVFNVLFMLLVFLTLSMLHQLQVLFKRNFYTFEIFLLKEYCLVAELKNLRRSNQRQDIS